MPDSITSGAIVVRELPFGPDGLATLWLLFFGYCFLGWCAESAYCSVLERKLVNRGFLNGPYLPIYGSGALLGLLLMQDVQSVAVLFLVGGALSCALEFATSWVMEKAYHARWWDYSHLPLNLDGRVWVGGFFEFGVGVVLVAKVAQPLLSVPLLLMSQPARATVAALTALTFFADLAVTHVGLSGFRSKMDDLVGSMRSRAFALGQWAPAIPHVPSPSDAMDALSGYIPSRSDIASLVGWERIRELSLGRRLGAARRSLSRYMPDVSLPQINMPVPKIELSALIDAARNAQGEVAEHFSSALNAQEKRILGAFPSLRPSEYQSMIDDLYDAYRKHAGRQ